MDWAYSSVLDRALLVQDPGLSSLVHQERKRNPQVVFMKALKEMDKIIFVERVKF